MALNPNIALQVRQPDIMGPDKLLTLQALSQQNMLGKLQYDEALKSRDKEEQLAGLFSQPGTVDPQTGTISLEGLTKAYGISPTKGASLAKDRQTSLKTAAEMAKLGIETETSKAKLLRDGLAQVTDQASYDAWRQLGARLESQAAMKAPAVFDPAWQRQNVMNADKFIEQNTPKIEMKDIGGQLVPVDVNPVTNPGIKGTNLAKTPTPDATMTDARVKAEGAANRAVTMRGQDLTDARVREANAAVAGKSTNEQENKMRDDFAKASKEFVSVRDAHQRVIESAKDPSAAGDLALIFNYMKVLDPGSTVREGEFATAQNSGGVPDRVVAYYNKVLAGERLAPNVRADFVTRSEKLYKGAVANQEEIEHDYEEKAKRAGVRAEQVVSKHRIKERPVELTPSEQEELKSLRARFKVK
jgi:hypothetical protein